MSGQACCGMSLHGKTASKSLLISVVSPAWPSLLGNPVFFEAGMGWMRKLDCKFNGLM